MALTAEPQANLVYHLDCLAKLVGCSRVPIASVWQSLPAREQDAAWLEAWHGARFELNRHSPAPRGAYRAAHPLDSPVLLARHTGHTLSDKEHEVLAWFRPRFEQWWARRAGAHAGRMKLALETLAAGIELPGLLERLAVFHDLAQETPTAVKVHLLSVPGPSAASTHAEIRAMDAYVETRIGESEAVRLGVVAHEVAHFYYALSPAKRRHAIRDWFLDNERSWSIAAYHLFNEALAAAFGNGLVESRLLSNAQFRQYVSFPDSFYADSYVDAAGKAALPLLERYLAGGRRVDKAFVDAYVDAIGEAMSAAMTELGFWLRTRVFTATTPSLAPLASIVGEHIVTGALFQETIAGRCTEPCLLQRYPELSGIVLALTKDLTALGEFLPAEAVTRVRRAAVGNRHAVYGYQRSPRSLLFVVTGHTEADVRDGLERLMRHGLIFVGSLAAPDIAQQGAVPLPADPPSR